MIVVDGRTSEEKLVELLAHGAECAELDYKEMLDLTDKTEELKLVKDLVAMLNNYPGGYLLIGVCDDGSPSERALDADWGQFDGKKLTDKVRKYVDALPEITSQHHTLDGHEYCLVCAMSLQDGLPIPFSKNGQSPNEKNPIFRRGDIVIRDGAGNDVVKHAQWGKILARYEQTIRESERSHIDVLVQRISDSLVEHGKTPPLFVGMDNDSLSIALEQCFEADEQRKIDSFITKISGMLNNSDDNLFVLASVGISAAIYSNKEVFERVSDEVYEYYMKTEPYDSGDPERRLNVVETVYALGSAAVRARKWSWLASLINRQSDPRKGYVYASWIRECQVTASRNDLFSENELGLVISATNQRIMNQASLRPDLTTADDGEQDAEAIGNAVLDSLCSFDMLYCVCVHAIGEGHGGAYPSCALFKDDRVSSTLRYLFSNDDRARRQFLPRCTDAQMAEAFKEFWEQAAQQAMQHGNWVWGFDKTGLVNPFLEKNLQDGKSE